MAYTSVIPVRRLDRTVDYVQNKAKTTPKSLEEAVDYAANRDKTESACFETGLGCTTTSAFEDMRLNTLRWHKETGVQGYHLVQSFAEGEVTPELAHQIGVEFAEQLLHGKYQAIVTTHLNTKHYHNHIVWSAVSLEDGKKYHSNSKSYYTEVRALSDALCQKYGLSIIETPESLRGKRQYEKWRAEKNNQPTWRTAIRQDVDDAIQQSLTWRQFLSVLERKGYEVRMGEVLADAPALQGFLDFMSQCRNSLPNQLLLSGQNADITEARTFQQWKDAGRHIRTGEEGYTAIIGQMYENNGRKASGYNIGKVFDITQTRGRPIPPPAEYQVDELIAAAIESSPVPIQISDSLPDGIQAQYVPKNRTIYVRNGMDAGTTLCAIVRECAQADFHKDYTYNRQAYAAPSYCAAYMVAHRYGLDTTAFNFDRVVALYGNLGKEQQRGFLSDVNTVGGGLLRSLSRTLAVQTRELPAAEYAVAVPPAKKPSRQQERG